MVETIEGQGKLEKWEAPDGQWDVRYDFTITTNVQERAGAPYIERSSVGTVERIDRGPLEQGIYRLYTDEEVMRVKDNGGVWTILAPIA